MPRAVARRTRPTWADLPLRAKGLVVVAIPLVALLVAALSSSLVRRQADDADAWVAHTLEVLGGLIHEYGREAA